MKDYIIVKQTEAENEDGVIKDGYEKRAYCYVKLVPTTPSYIVLRRVAYPPWQDYNDAKVKQASLDPVIQAEGLAQEQEYLDACLAVKAAFPKV